MPWRVVTCILAAAGLLASPSSAAAEDGAREGGIDVRWVAPLGCPTAAELVRRVRQIVGASDAPVGARVVVTQVGDRWRAEVHATGERVARQVDGESCDAVTDAVALILGVATDPDARASAPPGPRRTGPSVERTSPDTTASSRAALSSRDRLFAGATFVVRTGALPAPAVGPALTMGGRLGHTLLAGEIGFVTPTTATAASRPDQGAIFWLAQVGARAGYLWSAPSAAGATPRLEVGPCVGVSIERTAASGFGSREPADATAWAGVASGGGLVLVHFFDRLALRASIEAAAPLARPRFVIQGTGQVHQPTAVGARVGVGVDFQF